MTKQPGIAGYPPSTPTSCSDTNSRLHARLLALKASGRIRLDTEEINALTYALRDIQGEHISLFGSRVEPERRGGDIDILILTDQAAFALSQAVAVRFFTCCEEKIDVIVMNPNRLTSEQSDFLSRINHIEIAP